MTEQRCKADGCRSFPGLGPDGVVGAYCVPCLEERPELEFESRATEPLYSPTALSTSGVDHPHPHPSPHPCVTDAGNGAVAPKAKDADEKEVDGLIRGWIAGDDDLVPAELRQLDERASKNHKAVARFFAIVCGLRARVDHYEDVLFAQDWAAAWITELGHDISSRTVGRNLQDLREWGVLEKTDERRIPGRPIPAFLYRPCAVAVRGRAEVAGQRGHEPRSGAVDDPLVARAEHAVAEGSQAAVRHGAGDGSGVAAGVHNEERTPPGCRS